MIVNNLINPRIGEWNIMKRLFVRVWQALESRESFGNIMKLCTAGKFLVKRRVHETEAMKSYSGVRIT